MLCLGRTEGQRVVLSGGIIVTVVSVDGKRVRLGFEAPDHVRIDREEIWNANQNDNPAPEANPCKSR